MGILGTLEFSHDYLDPTYNKLNKKVWLATGTLIARPVVRGRFLSPEVLGRILRPEETPVRVGHGDDGRTSLGFGFPAAATAAVRRDSVSVVEIVEEIMLRLVRAF